MNYKAFLSFLEQSDELRESACRRVYIENQEKISIKKERTAIKNLKKILDAVFEISLKKGFSAMTMRELSNQAGLSLGALYPYFKSKDELLNIILKQGMSMVSRVLESVIQLHTHPSLQLEAVIKAHLYLSEKERPWFYFMFMEAKNLKQDQWKAVMDAELYTEKVIVDILQAGAESGVFKDQNHVLTACIIKSMQQEWYLKRWKYVHRNMTVDAYAEYVLGFVKSFCWKNNGEQFMENKPHKSDKGEILDTQALSDYFNQNLSGLEIKAPLSVKKFQDGYSNLTYLLKSDHIELVLRRPPVGANIKSAHDMKREFKILSSLQPVFPYCPEPVIYCDDTSVIGADFYVMKRISGIILRKELPDCITIRPSDAKKLCQSLLDVHIELHHIDVKSAGLDFLGKPEGYVGRQVSGWCNRYHKAKTDDAPDFESIMIWLNEKQPKDTEKPVIVHNDYKFDNVVLSPENLMKIIGVLDWEMATYGDPLMDLGNSLAYWIQKDDPESMQQIRVMPTNIDGAMTRDEIIAYYGEKTGRDVSGFDYYYCFGLFRLAVIAQQIYRRYRLGMTQDNRFAGLIHVVRVLEQSALSVINKTTI
jgi:aminoglycoside phosphotransferase (APT) family kinase protein/AcrR family transcriptional regulator